MLKGSLDFIKIKTKIEPHKISAEKMSSVVFIPVFVLLSLAVDDLSTKANALMFISV